jgi:L-malate glycosyltransferase
MLLKDPVIGNIVMRIGIVSVCDVYALLDYLDEESRCKVKGFRKNAAPSVNNLILGLLKRNCKVVLFTTDASVDYLHLKGNLLDIYVVKGFNQYPLKYFIKVLIDGYRLAKLILSKVDEIDVLHAHWTYEFALGTTRVVEKVPVFCTIRDWAPAIFSMEKLKDKFHWFVKLTVSKLIFRNSRINFIANSDYIARKMEENYGMKIPVIYNILNPSFVSYSIEQKKESEFVFLCLSMTIDKWKNIPTLLKAFQFINNKYSNVRLMLIGPPFYAENPEIKSWKAEGLLPDQVILVGKVTHKDLPKYIDKCSVLVQPSLEESFGNTVIEGMSRGLAVIGGKNSGAVPYLLENGRSGCLCDVSDPISIFNAMDKVYSDPQYRKQLIENALVSINRFNEQAIIESHISLYHSQMKEVAVA